MSLGWGQIPKGEWDQIKTTPGADIVPPADYEVVPEKVRMIEPGESGVGVYIVQLKTTAEGNQDEWANKQLDYRMNFDPSPGTEGRKTMNAISQQKAKAFIDACNMEAVVDGNGNVDIVQSLEAACATQARLIVAVVHETRNGREYQDCERVRPAI